jgi:lipoprotein-releasing system ATP-binding protein
LPEFSALENVAMPMFLAKKSKHDAFDSAREVLNLVGLAARLQHKPVQLSGGERQRVAIARALVHQPACVLADEPTGNLDHQTALKIFDVMLTLNQRYRTALVMVTHDLKLAEQMDTVWALYDGKLHDPRKSS